ncbi:MAG: hypothetical protein ACTSRG_22615 [Candidatus Helarchaeota archaeon]
MEKIKELNLESEELKDQNILLSNIASLTPSNFEFSALRSKTQNLQYLGKLWLTEKELIFKGYKLEELSPIREPANKIVVKLSEEYEITIDLSKIKKCFVGHDENFGRRHQIFSKLRISVDSETHYFILFDEKLVSVKEELYERSKKWQTKIEELQKPLVKAPVKPTIAIPKPKTIKPVIAMPKPVVKPVPKPVSKPIAKPVISVPKIAPTSTPLKPTTLVAKPKSAPKPAVDEPSVELSEDLLPNIARLKQASKSAKSGKIVKPILPKPVSKEDKLKVPVKPKVKEKTATEILREEEARLRPKFKVTKVKAYEAKGTSYTPLKASMKPTPTNIKVDEDSAIEKVLGDIREEMDIEILSTEFDSMAADTSINKCPYCGWLLAWDQHKCPKCRKNV